MNGEHVTLPHGTSGRFRLEGFEDHKRVYAENDAYVSLVATPSGDHVDGAECVERLNDGQPVETNVAISANFAVDGTVGSVKVADPVQKGAMPV